MLNLVKWDDDHTRLVEVETGADPDEIPDLTVIATLKLANAVDGTSFILAGESEDIVGFLDGARSGETAIEEIRQRMLNYHIHRLQMLFPEYTQALEKVREQIRSGNLTIAR